MDVLYRYELHPNEAAMLGLGKLKEVYGIRRVVIDEAQKTVRVEYDATRLNTSSITQLLRRGGISILNELPLIAPQSPIEHPDEALAAQPVVPAK